MDEVQQAILALKNDLAQRTASTEEALQAVHKATAVNAETIKAVTMDTEASHQVSECVSV